MQTLAKELLPQFTTYQARAPLPTDDVTLGLIVGLRWVDTSVTPNNEYVCLSVLTGAAVWLSTTNPGANIKATTLANLQNTPVAVIVPVSYTLFTPLGAVLTGSETLLTLPANYKILGCDIIQHTGDAHFAAPSLSACHLTVGITGTLNKYATSTDVFTAGANLGDNSVQGVESISASTAILVTATAVGANLGTLTAGTCNIVVSMVNLLG